MTVSSHARKLDCPSETESESQGRVDRVDKIITDTLLARAGWAVRIYANAEWLEEELLFFNDILPPSLEDNPHAARQQTAAKAEALPLERTAYYPGTESFLAETPPTFTPANVAIHSPRLSTPSPRPLPEYTVNPAVCIEELLQGVNEPLSLTSGQDPLSRLEDRWYRHRKNLARALTSSGLRKVHEAHERSARKQAAVAYAEAVGIARKMLVDHQWGNRPLQASSPKSDGKRKSRG